MSEPRYRIIFSGKPLPETSVQTVQDNLVQLFQITPEKAAAMLSKGPHILKKDLSEAQATKYLAALHRAGAAAHKEQEVSAPPAPSQRESAQQAPTNPYAPPRARVADSETQEYGELNPWTVQGRIGRLRYMAWFNALVLATMAASVVFAAVFNGVLGASDTLSLVFAIPLMLFVLLCSIRIYAQRLHDMGLSAWFVLVVCIPIIGTLFLLVMIFWPGNKEENDYGLPPPTNTKGVVLWAFSWIFIAIIGIIAAIVLPAYHDYTQRAAQVSASPMSPPPAPAPLGR